MDIVYNIHDVLKIKIKNISRHLVKDMNLRYHYFETNDENDLDINVTIGRFEPDLKNCFCLDRKFYIRKNYVYLRDSNKNLRWEAEISGLEEDVIRINYNFSLKNYLRFPWCLFPDLVLDFYVLEPIIEWKLSLRDCLLTHAGAVCKDGKATLLIGRGGSRKTQTVIDLLEKGFDLISDDMVILKNMEVLSLPLSPGLFTFCYERLKNEDINFLNQFRLFNFLSKKNLNLTPIVDSAKLKEAFILLPKKGADFEMRDLELNDFLQCLKLNQDMEKTSYVSYKYIIGSFLKAYEYVFPKISFDEPMNKLRMRLRDDLKKNKIVPKSVRFSTDNNISELLCQ